MNIKRKMHVSLAGVVAALALTTSSVQAAPIEEINSSSVMVNKKLASALINQAKQEIKLAMDAQLQQLKQQLSLQLNDNSVNSVSLHASIGQSKNKKSAKQQER